MLLQDNIVYLEKNISLADSLANNLLEMESDKRGFQLTGEVEYLQDIYLHKFRSKDIVSRLKFSKEGLLIKEVMLQLDSLLNERLNNFDSGIIVYTTLGLASSIEFMKQENVISSRKNLYSLLEITKNGWVKKWNKNVFIINKKSKQNITDLLILLVVSVVMMFKTADVIKKSQQRIINSHFKFKEAQRIAKIGSWEWDIQSNKLRWSQEQFRLFGEERGDFDLTYEGYISHLSVIDREIVEKKIKLAIEGKELFSFEHEIIRKDGSKLMVFEQGTVQFNQRNEPIGMFGTTQDITEQKTAEKETARTKEKLQKFFDNAADGIYQSTKEGKFIIANPSMAKIFGYESPEDLISSIQNISQEIYANPIERNKMADWIMANGHVENYELQVLTKGKNIKWVSANIRIERKDDGEIEYFEGVLEDITDKKNAEAELNKIQKQYQEIFDNTLDGISQSSLDGKFIMANASMAKILGYDSPEDLITSISDIGEQVYANPAERAKMVDRIKLLGQVENYEIQMLTKENYVIWVSANIRIVYKEDGSIDYFEGSLEDISDRKKAEEELINLSNRLQLAIRATSIGIWDWDMETNNTVWDHEMYKIYDVEPLNSLNVSEAWTVALHPEDLERVNEELQLAAKGEKEFDSEFRVIWKDKSVHYVKGNALVLRNKDGKALHMVGTNKDITVEKVAEEEILQLNKSLDQFANITAHDLQEPIRMVSGFLGLLEKKYSDAIDEVGKTYIHRAKDGADRMSILIRDLLEFSRSGNTAAKKESVDLSVVMDLVNRDLSIVKEDTNTILCLPTSLPVITGTESAIYRLFLNLVSNGIKFRKKDTSPVVKLEIGEDSDFWKFTLQDNGIGVAEKDQPKLFQAFQRLHRKEVYPGTGLGLVTCKKIVEIHGGKIWMTSVEGEGTAFHFTLPKNGLAV